MGLPFYRLAKMQKMLGIPLAVSTQSDLVESMKGPIHAIFNLLTWIMAQSDLIYQDDSKVRILALIKENLQLNPERKGMFTSGFIGEGEHTVVLFYSGRKHSGENFGDIIEAREESRGPVTRMSDALAANSINDPDDINEAKCNAHLFRRFRTLLTTYPDAAKFVLQTYGKIYDYEEHCKNHHFDDDARLAYHQQHSQPLMEQMKSWVEDVLLDYEPSSPLVKECQYLLNHWKELCLFLRVPGAPLDNNRLEAMMTTRQTG
jgi:transposase